MEKENQLSEYEQHKLRRKLLQQHLGSEGSLVKKPPDRKQEVTKIAVPQKSGALLAENLLSRLKNQPSTRPQQKSVSSGSFVTCQCDASSFHREDCPLSFHSSASSSSWSFEFSSSSSSSSSLASSSVSHGPNETKQELVEEEQKDDISPSSPPKSSKKTNKKPKPSNEEEEDYDVSTSSTSSLVKQSAKIKKAVDSCHYLKFLTEEEKIEYAREVEITTLKRQKHTEEFFEQEHNRRMNLIAKVFKLLSREPNGCIFLVKWDSCACFPTSYHRPVPVSKINEYKLTPSFKELVAVWLEHLRFCYRNRQDAGSILQKHPTIYLFISTQTNATDFSSYHYDEPMLMPGKEFIQAVLKNHKFTQDEIDRIPILTLDPGLEKYRTIKDDHYQLNRDDVIVSKSTKIVLTQAYFRDIGSQAEEALTCLCTPFEVPKPVAKKKMQTNTKTKIQKKDQQKHHPKSKEEEKMSESEEDDDHKNQVGASKAALSVWNAELDDSAQSRGGFGNGVKYLKMSLHNRITLATKKRDFPHKIGTMVQVVLARTVIQTLHNENKKTPNTVVIDDTKSNGESLDRDVFFIHVSSRKGFVADLLTQLIHEPSSLSSSIEEGKEEQKTQSNNVFSTPIHTDPTFLSDAVRNQVHIDDEMDVQIELYTKSKQTKSKTSAGKPAKAVPSSSSSSKSARESKRK